MDSRKDRKFLEFVKPLNDVPEDSLGRYQTSMMELFCENLL